MTPDRCSAASPASRAPGHRSRLGPGRDRHHVVGLGAGPGKDPSRSVEPERFRLRLGAEEERAGLVDVPGRAHPLGVGKRLHRIFLRGSADCVGVERGLGPRLRVLGSDLAEAAVEGAQSLAVFLHGPALPGAERALDDRIEADRHLQTNAQFGLVPKLVARGEHDVRFVRYLGQRRRDAGDPRAQELMARVAAHHEGHVDLALGDPTAGVRHEGLLEHPDGREHRHRRRCADRAGDRAGGIAVGPSPLRHEDALHLGQRIGGPGVPPRPSDSLDHQRDRLHGLPRIVLALGRGAEPDQDREPRHVRHASLRIFWITRPSWLRCR